MKNNKLHVLIILLSTLAQLHANSDIQILLSNKTKLYRDEVIKINLDSLKVIYPDLIQNSFIVKEVEKEIPSEIITDSSGFSYLLIYTQLKSGETRILTLSGGKRTDDTRSLTRAYLGEKNDFQKSKGYYTKGYFKEVSITRVPTDHFAHDALYQFEGPGWESELVGYRLYLDSRNRTDIFGKTKKRLLLDKVGLTDLSSDGKESYQKLQDWGMDIFKVGNSLGIGSPAIFSNDSVVTVSNTDSLICMTYSNKFRSSVSTYHYGWKVFDKVYDIASSYSIHANSRLTQVDIKLDKNDGQFCTGLAKHADTEFLKSDETGNWNYIALWGKQTTNSDNLGIAVFYQKSNIQRLSEDQLNYLLIFNPMENYKYYFSAVWEKDEEGINSKDGFIDYLNTELQKLNNPLTIIVRLL